MTIIASYQDIFAPFDRAPPDRPFVVAQLGQSLDGRVATHSGDAANVSGKAGLDHLHRLRARADVVVVGAGTAAADDPQLTVRRVDGRNPARAVIDPGGRTAGCARWRAADGVKRYLITATGAADNCDEVIRLPAREGRIDPALVVRSLFERGMRIILLEGGPATLAAFLEAGSIDRLHVFVSPVIIGSGKAAIDLPPIEKLDQALRPPARTFQFAGGEVLFDCDMRG
ncbi:MAG: RibD family protein [Beijerinckiaceae bacterium]